ncbi:MAG: apolipoprotein N-acyltransferase [Pseudomonadota bacterium]
MSGGADEEGQSAGDRPRSRPLPGLLSMIAGLSGWRRHVLSFFAGAGTAAALAPFYVWPLLAVGFGVLFILISEERPGGPEQTSRKDPKRVRRAAIDGWWFGFGYFLLGIYWLGFSFLVQADQFAWMAPFAVLGMPAFLAVFFALPAAIATAVQVEAWRRAVLFAALISVFEYLRGHILTGFPWNLTGQAFAGLAATSQTAALWGAYGLSFLTLLIAFAPVATLRWRARPWAGGAFAAFLVATLSVYGILRIEAIGEQSRDGVVVRVVQPNIAQREKIDPSRRADNFYRHIDLSLPEDKSAPAVVVIWPENATPFLHEARDALSVLAARLPANATLLAGTVRLGLDGEGEERAFNSFAAIDDINGAREAVATYDKHHLAPFGEYLPMRSVLRAVGLAQLAPFEQGFKAGPGPRTISLANAEGSSLPTGAKAHPIPPFAPLICYETVFPGRLYPRGDRPEWLVTVTNDAWFGDSSGPRQHLDQSRLRTIETGLPMARSANTGISAIIDARGVYVARAQLYSKAALEAPLPQALAPTLYARFGDLFYFVMVFSAVGVSFFAVRK